MADSDTGHYRRDGWTVAFLTLFYGRSVNMFSKDNAPSRHETTLRNVYLSMAAYN